MGAIRARGDRSDAADALEEADENLVDAAVQVMACSGGIGTCGYSDPPPPPPPAPTPTTNPGGGDDCCGNDNPLDDDPQPEFNPQTHTPDGTPIPGHF